MQNQISSTLQILLFRFQGAILIPFVAASESVGIPEQTARNMLSGKTYPIPTELRGSRRFIHISDLADYVDSTRSKPKRGRRTKASKFQASQQSENGVHHLAEHGRAV